MTGERIMVRSPGRVNLIGDHTDYTGGLAFPMAIDLATEIVAEPNERVVLHSDADEVDVDLDLGGKESPLDTLTGWARHVRAVVDEVRPALGIAGQVTTGIPVGAGLSSSASLGLALAVALGFEGTPEALARLAQRAEHAATGVPTGLLDQLCIASATAGHGTLIDASSVSTQQMPIPEDAVFVVRFIAHRTLEGSGYADRVAECRAAELHLGPLRGATLADVERLGDPLLRRRARHVVTENQRVGDFAAALGHGDLTAAGTLMDASHASLRDDYAVSTPGVDDAVASIRATPGVLGARITGGGFGGCVVALCTPGARVDGWRVRPSDGIHRVE